ncbi:MAG: helix-turn-helix domain-containing protein, partial [Eubacteriales bacterium]
NGIMFLTDCEFEYTRSDGSVFERAGKNQIIYSPIGSEYSCRFIVPEKCPADYVSDYLINFRLYSEKNGEEFRLADDRLILTPENPGKYIDSFAKISSLQRKGYMMRPKIKGLIYELLCDISLELQKSDLMNHRYAAILPAIRYIRATDLAEINISGLAQLCHLSESCFRRLFTAYFGKPPLKYINELRIAQAEERLRSGMMTVSEVAESLGFSDASYFSRFYKKETGRSPRSELP